MRKLLKEMGKTVDVLLEARLKEGYWVQVAAATRRTVEKYASNARLWLRARVSLMPKSGRGALQRQSVLGMEAWQRRGLSAK